MKSLKGSGNVYWTPVYSFIGWTDALLHSPCAWKLTRTTRYYIPRERCVVLMLSDENEIQIISVILTKMTDSEPTRNRVKSVSSVAESQQKTLLSTLGNFHVKWPIMLFIPVCVSRNTDLLSPCELTVTKPRLLRPCVLPFILNLFQKSERRRARDMGHWLSLNRKSSPQTCFIIDCSCQTLIVLPIMEQRPLYTSLTCSVFFGEAQRMLKQAAELWEL